MRELTADVCMIGGGYAGLMAARTVTKTASSAIVLEARDRVGGRVWTRPECADTPDVAGRSRTAPTWAWINSGST
jgi:monoamine oxidase